MNKGSTSERILKHCRVCDGTSLESAVDLGRQPWCNHFLKKEEVGKEPFYPLHVVYCTNCQTAQLNYTVPKETMFGDHTYLSGVTKSLSAHFKGIAEEVDSRYFRDTPGKSVLDIGSNDGTQLKSFQDLKWDVLGVESSKSTAQIAQSAGVPTVNEFFNQELVRKLGKKFHVINAAGVFFHLEELHSVAEGIRETLRDDGVFVVQFLYMKRIMENLAFDQIYHEHLLYYNLATIQKLLDRHGMEMFDAYPAPIHGGSIIGFVTHKEKRPVSDRLKQMRNDESRSGCNELAAYKKFSVRIEEMKHENLRYLKQKKIDGKVVYGMGAPVKGNTMLNHFGVGPGLIPYLVEKNELRKGLYSPGMHIPIILEREIDKPPDVYYVLAWNFKKEILANNQDLIRSGVEFYFPVQTQG